MSNSNETNADKRKKYASTVRKIRIDTVLDKTLLIDVELDGYSLEIRNIVCVLSPDTNRVYIEMPQIWNPTTMEEFNALNFNDTEIRIIIFNQIRGWIEKQDFLMDFLRNGWKEVAVV